MPPSACRAARLIKLREEIDDERLVLATDEQISLIKPFIPKNPSKKRADDRGF